MDMIHDFRFAILRISEFYVSCIQDSYIHDFTFPITRIHHFAFLIPRISELHVSYAQDFRILYFP